MSQFRFIVEGSDFKMPSVDEAGEDDFVTGFFTTRKSRAPDVEAATAIVLDMLRDEWREYRPTLRVVDVWRISGIRLWRVPNQGHVFFSDQDSRFAAASLEARAARAPKDAAIWDLASNWTEDDD